MYRLYLDGILILSSLESPATIPVWPLLECHSGRLVIFPMCVPAGLNHLSARLPGCWLVAFPRHEKPETFTHCCAEQDPAATPRLSAASLHYPMARESTRNPQMLFYEKGWRARHNHKQNVDDKEQRKNF